MKLVNRTPFNTIHVKHIFADVRISRNIDFFPGAAEVQEVQYFKYNKVIDRDHKSNHEPPDLDMPIHIKEFNMVLKI